MKLKFTILAFSVALLQSVAWPATCFSLQDRDVSWERVWDRQIPYSKKTVSTESFYPQKIVGDPSVDDLYIGFEDFHAYFVFRNQRFDGGFMPLLLWSKISHHNGQLSPGVILRVRNVPKEFTEVLLKDLKSHEHELAFTCAQGLCTALHRNGLKVPGIGKIYPSRVLKNILLRGIQTRTGQRLETELILVNTPSLETHFFKTHLLETAITAIAVFATTSVLIWVN